MNNDMEVGLMRIVVFIVAVLFSFSAVLVVADEESTRKVRTVPVVMVDDEVVVEVTGTLMAHKHSVLSFKVAGTVSEVLVDVGSVVKKGDVLARLDDTDYKLQLRQAEAQLRLARAQLAKLKAGFRAEEIEQAEAGLEAMEAQLREALSGFREEDVKAAEAAVKSAEAAFELAKKNKERTEALFKDGAVSRQAYDTALMQFQSASAQLEGAKWRLTMLKKGLRSEQIDAIRAQVKRVQKQVEMLKRGFRKEDIEAAEAQVALASVAVDYAKKQLADTELKSPYDGVVVARMVDVGNYVVTMMRTPVFEVMDISLLHAYLEIPDKYVMFFSEPGAKVLLDVDGGPKDIESKVVAVSHSLLLPSRKFRVKVPVQNGDMKMKAGMFVRAKVYLGKEKVAAIPRGAVLKDSKGEYVILVEDNRAVKRHIVSRGVRDDLLLVEKGLGAEDVVILDPVGIMDGEKVVEEK